MIPAYKAANLSTDTHTHTQLSVFQKGRNKCIDAGIIALKVSADTRRCNYCTNKLMLNKQD